MGPETSIGAVNYGTFHAYGDVVGTKRDAGRGARPPGIDVLIVTAIPEEYHALRQVTGRARWTDHDPGGEAPYATAELGPLSVALARPIRMGGRSTAGITITLTERLGPGCLAMCGVCAGDPARTALGDVVVAESAYEWDEGRRTDAGLLPAPQQFPQDSRWVRAAQEFSAERLPSYGAATGREAAAWFLERLHRGQDPRRHPARSRYLPGAAWAEQLGALESAGLIAWRDGRFGLTGPGADRIERLLYGDADGPARLPYAVVTGPMASGSAVMTASGVWAELGAHQRDLVALDMEAASIATVAHDRNVPHWLVAKGVSDHADAHKDDRFKAFAARASAEVLLALLEDLLAPSPPAPSPPADPVPGPVRAEVARRLRYYWPDLADAFGVPSNDIRRFRPGDEPHDLWAWLEHRHRLAELPGALDEIGLADLAGLLRPYV